MNFLKIALLALALFAIPALAGPHGGGGHSSSRAASSGKVHVKGYTKKDGTHVAAHDRTAPNGTQKDNWSAKGNTNPETGKEGTKEPAK